jgi:hypothetical protein
VSRRPNLVDGDRRSQHGLMSEPSTRRAVVRTGAKLAYAAPLVAATIRLRAVNVLAMSAGNITRVYPRRGVDVFMRGTRALCLRLLLRPAAMRPGLRALHVQSPPCGSPVHAAQGML